MRVNTLISEITLYHQQLNKNNIFKILKTIQMKNYYNIHKLN